MDILSLAAPIVLAVLKVVMEALVGFVLTQRGVLHETAMAKYRREYESRSTGGQVWALSRRKVQR